jgi:hypothetical protein
MPLCISSDRQDMLLVLLFPDMFACSLIPEKTVNYSSGAPITRGKSIFATRHPNLEPSASIPQIHLQPIPEGQSSEEVILAAVVGKTTPDIYANMWQGNVEMYARAGVLIPLDTLHGFLQFIHERCDSAVIREITSVDGHIYQVPWKVNPFMTIYNKNLVCQKRHPHALPKPIAPICTQLGNI